MSGNKRALGSDLAKVDAHVITPEEYDDIPEITDDMMAQGAVMLAGKPVRRGRPPSAAPKKLISLRLSARVIEHYRAGGDGWQTRLDEDLCRLVDQRR